MMTKRHIYSIFTAIAMMLPALLTSCAEESLTPGNLPATEVDDSGLVESRLLLDVADMDISAASTRADEEPEQFTDEEKRGLDSERRIKNIWLFQFNASTKKLLITPRYYDISDKNATPDEQNGVTVDVLLKPNINSIIYVVANTGLSNWANVSNSATYDDVKELTIPGTQCFAIGIDGEQDALLLPMEGGEEIKPENGEEIKLRVTRMFAKVEIMVENIPESIRLTAVDVKQIASYCRVSSIAPAHDAEAAVYPPETIWISRAFSHGEKEETGHFTQKMTLYVPENLQGKNDNIKESPERKTERAKVNALCVDFMADYVNIFTGEIKQKDRHYKVYPGANNYNDYNIKRNHIYRVRLNIYTDKYEQDTPSSNCFVLKPDQHFSFLPYYRTETGGGYDFKTYLDAEGDESKKINDYDNMTENVRIIWQTKDAIGDNTNGDRVWIDHLTDAKDEFHRKIHVRTGKRGNALIAAYNSKGEIIWSWHIWVTENDPGNISNAIVYSTYAWDEKGIHPDIRVPGYAIMPCNLGAMKDKPDGDSYDTDTYGMLYQWGRKDPFPPMKVPKKFSGYYNYSDEQQPKGGINVANIEVYDNEHSHITITGNGSIEVADVNEVFKTTKATDVGGDTKTKAASLMYSIHNPTHFISAAATILSSEKHYNNGNSYINRGDWLLEGDECLWGAIPRTENMKRWKYPGYERYIWDNYGPDKTIFDPCPSGWRVPPGDLWLGFTNDGLNHGFNTYNINCVETKISEVNKKNGYSMYLQLWHDGIYSFFPTQGSRLASGQPYLGGVCGNYHNATTDKPISTKASDGTFIDRVNILHLHSDDGAKVNIFEDQLLYYVKAVGGPVRCVRDHR